MSPVYLFDRKRGALATETVYEDAALRWLYGSRLGLLSSELFAKRRWFSQLYRWSRSSSRAQDRIHAFVRAHAINLDECEKPVEQYASFADFFVRKLKPEARPIDPRREALISPADARLLAYELAADTVLPIKGRAFRIAELIGCARTASLYRGGRALVFRLAPADYHRFVYIDDGAQTAVTRLGSFLHSVHPFSLGSMRRVFSENVRDWCVLDTESFGPVLHTDVGALAVGRIVEHERGPARFFRGQEKGYFELGGSTIVLVFAADTLELDADIVGASQRGHETLVRMGEALGRRRD